MTSRPVLWLTAASVLACVALGCGSDEDAQPTTNGVNDVSKACAIRAQWSRAGSECIECLTTSSVPRCECSTKDYAGKCSGQQTARNDEPTCQGVPECVYGCNDDCACIDACYANKDVCRQKGSALDGCLAAICDAYCR